MNGNQEIRRKRKHRAAEYEVIPLRKFIRLLERYNRVFGTRYNYGRAVQALRDGIIDRKNFMNLDVRR